MSHQNIMVPPWKTSHQPQTSLLWRMGGGEEYLDRWHDWFTALSDTEQQAYMAQYPEPEDWFCFYRIHLLPPINWDTAIEACGDDPTKLPEGFFRQLRQPAHELVEKVERLWNTYCTVHYELALMHEEADHIQQAVDHLGKVLGIIRHNKVWEVAKEDEVKKRYILLKQRLTQQMAMKPTNFPEEFFDQLSQPDSERVEKAERFWNTYCNLHDGLALVHEEAEHIQQAVEHLTKVLVIIEQSKVLEVTKVDETKKRYTLLKQRLTQQMAINPIIREGWNALRQSDQHTCIALKRTTVTAEDYARIQKEIYFPSELGRTWIKCFENDTLYIHRHWNEPCLFLVILEPAEQGYRIAETWMNNDPAIPRPLTRPPTEPDLLLTQLLGRFIKE